MKGKILITAVLFSCLTTPLMAGDPAEVVVGKEYVLQETMNIRNAPPKGMLYSLGEKQGEIKKDDTITVQRVKPVKTLFGSHYWVEITKEDAATGKVDKGWVDAGEKGKESLLKEKVHTSGGPE